ncbi:hypothetical protein ACSDQ9_07665 [Aestuariimicrobium soli]|uniref:hypothetical protein n=1 Tax=Aestuariimicrobium soli TaxID=2035834 RepID=UPI003EC028B3
MTTRTQTPAERWTVSSTFNDLLVVDDRALALTLDHLLWVGPVACVLIEECAAGPRDLTRLAEVCREAFGEPPGGGLLEAVAGQVAELVESGLLQRVGP